MHEQYTHLHNVSANATTGLTAATESTASAVVTLSENEGVVLQFQAKVQGTAGLGATLNVYRSLEVQGTSWDTTPFAAISLAQTGGIKQVTGVIEPSEFGGGRFKTKVRNDDMTYTLLAYSVWAKKFTK
jgi:hypothetical protein